MRGCFELKQNLFLVCQRLQRGRTRLFKMYRESMPNTGCSGRRTAQPCCPSYFASVPLQHYYAIRQSPGAGHEIT